MKCSYPSHNGMSEHPADVFMSSPGDKLGRHRLVACCYRAAEFAKGRGYVQMGTVA